MSPPGTGAALAVLDLDNVVAPWWEHEDEALHEVVEVALTALASLPADAEVVAACTHRVARRLATVGLAERVTTFHRVRARPDAADRILLAALRTWEPPGPGEAWIVSGDRRFAGAVGRLRRAGHDVVVLAPLAGLAPSLLAKADRLLDLRRSGAVEVPRP